MPNRSITISRMPPFTVRTKPLFYVNVMEERGDDVVCILTSAPVNEEAANLMAEEWAKQYHATREK